MTLFLSFLQGRPDHSIAGYSFWEYYLKNGVSESRNKWIECSEIDWAIGLVPQSEDSFNEWKSISWEKTIEFLKRNPVDLFLSYLYPHMVDESAIKVIQKMGIPCVNFFCDNVRNFMKIPIQFKVFDLHWVPEYKALELYRNENMPALHLPMPMWVTPSNRIICKEQLPQISFIGSNDFQRVNLFERICSLDMDLPIAIYGSGWTGSNINTSNIQEEYTIQNKIRSQFDFIHSEGLVAYSRKIINRGNKIAPSATLLKRVKGKVSFEDYICISKESMITVGVNRYPSFHFPKYSPNTYSRLRDIEAPMLGCCFLTEWTTGLDYMYDIDKEILVYTTPEHFIEQSQRLISDKKMRDSLRVNGQRKALEELTIPKSLKKLEKYFKYGTKN